MATIKIVLDRDTAYSGPMERGQVQVTLSELAENIINGNIIIQQEIEQKERTVTFRLPQEKIEQLKEIAGTNNISVQKLLRLAMVQNSLLVQTN